MAVQGLRFVQLFQELMTGLEAVMRANDCHDGPAAELLLLDIKPVYADLLDHLEDRKRWHAPTVAGG